MSFHAVDYVLRGVAELFDPKRVERARLHGSSTLKNP